MSPPVPPGLSPDSPLGRLIARIGQLIDEGRFADAIAPMREAAAMQPDNPRIQTDLGGLYLEAGQPEAAVSPLRRAIALNPHIAVAHWRLGTALQATGDTAGAIEALEQAVLLQPSRADAHYRLGLLYRGLGRKDDALDSWRSAARSETDPATRHFFQAQVLITEGHEEEAEPLLRAAIRLEPEMGTVRGLLAEILAASGRFDEAAQLFEAELVKSPRGASLYYGLARSRTFTAADDDLLSRMDAVLAREDLDDANRGVLLLARGKAHDDLGRYDRAMESWDAASEARARVVPFDLEGFEAHVDAIIRLFGRELLARDASGCDDRTPVMIVGMPRSGTTLVEQIVSSHPAAVGAGELAFWKKRLQIALQSGPDGLGDAFIAASAAGYVEELRLVSPIAARVTDKDPFNYLALGLIHLAFPRAAIIHCRRNAIDTALSIHQTHFASSLPMPTGGEALVGYFRAYERLMAHWRQVLPPQRMLEVGYETLTASPETGIREIIAYVGLEWNDACLKPQDNHRIVRTPSRWQVRQPINTKSVERWRRYKPWLGPLGALAQNAG